MVRKNVTISTWWNYGEPDDNAFPDAPELGKTPHAQEAMRHMGITYATAEPRPISDCWVFFDCNNIPEEPYQKWMTVSEGGRTAQEIYADGMSRVATDPEPNGQKFPVGSRVKIKDLGPGMSNFPSGLLATVNYTYAHAYGGSDVTSYSLDVDGIGSIAWYEEHQLSGIHRE